ncbi:SusD family protein [Pedobacter africanus]|uniref:SusD family protein n=2 Tax=Pedobacter africanus TaxID=151894 RepID=A0A1W2CUF6_9SPHI|nr:SusD family protein [Pedobacter africanus]
MLLLTACNKKLDIVPEDTLTERQALEKQASAEGILGDAYTKLFEACREQAYTMGDQSTEMMEFQPYLQHNRWYEGLYGPRTNEDESMPINFWANNYKTINLANVVINKLPAYGQFNRQLMQQYVAEAKFIRAFSYFNLLKYFGDGALEGRMEGLGVPLRLEAYDGYDASKNIPRSSNKKVYEQILKDIDEAIPELVVAFGNEVSTRSRAVKGSANALGARVALYMQNYELALKYSNEVLMNANYVDAASILDVFADNSGNEIGKQTKLNMAIPELIFAFPVSHNNAGLNSGSSVNHGIDYIFGGIFFNPAFLSSYESNDIRANQLFINVSFFSLPPVKISRKFSDPNQTDNLVAFRRAELVLTKAEALANINGLNQQSVDLLNLIHQRSFVASQRPVPYTMGSFGSKQALIDAILRERSWELAGEGQDRFDRMRTGRNVNPVLPRYKYALPVPYKEIVITGGLIEQNTGY